MPNWTDINNIGLKKDSAENFFLIDQLDQRDVSGLMSEQM